MLRTLEERGLADNTLIIFSSDNGPHREGGHDPDVFRKTQFETELQRMIKGLWNHPSIVNWIVFNEHWGAYDVEWLTEMVMALDSSRLITGNSGMDAGRPHIDYEVGHIKDNHHYRPPTNPMANNRRAAVNGE